MCKSCHQKCVAGCCTGYNRSSNRIKKTIILGMRMLVTQAQDQHVQRAETGGARAALVFKGVSLLTPLAPLTPSTCGPSLAEERFRNALEAEMGIEFVANSRPNWLMNLDTGMNLELDMFHPGLRLAVEYDGPQHTSFPNPYHATRREFEAQQARDRLKDMRCREHGVHLVRVPHSDDLEAQLALARDSIASRS